MGPLFRCPDCGTWWAGFEHRCRRETSTATAEGVTIGGTLTVKCNCVFDAMGLRIPQTATCPVHDITWTYTTSNARFPA